MKNIIAREAKRITSYPTEIVDYLSKEDNWIKIDPDGVMGDVALMSYPDEIYILSLKNASKTVTDFFADQGEYKEELVFKHNIFNDMEEELEELSDEEYDNMNYHTVFAYVYPDNGEEDIHNEDLFATKDHAFIFNGLELKDKDYEEQALSALNVKNYTVL